MFRGDIGKPPEVSNRKPLVRLPMYFLIYCWQADVVQIALTREKLFALAIFRSGEYCCRDQVVVNDGLWCETLFAILLRFCFHRGDQFFHLRVVECGERTVPNFLVEIDNCSRVCVQCRNSNSLAALVLLAGLNATRRDFNDRPRGFRVEG